MYAVAADRPDAVPRGLSVTPDPASPYAAVARWESISLRDGAIIAIGGAAGGAHSNTRWTTWAGRVAASGAGGGPAGSLREHPQSFYAFGGYGAGGLLDAVATDAGNYLVGTWNGTTGLDAAIWYERRGSGLSEGASAGPGQGASAGPGRRSPATSATSAYERSGLRWERAESAGTALASSPTELVGARAATSTGPGILVVGNVTTLGDGVRRSAAVWRSAQGAQDWRRIDLPDSGSTSEARSAACAADGCVVAGVADGRYAMWWLPAQAAPRRLSGLPDLAVADRDPVPAPVRSASPRGVAGLGDLVAVAGDVLLVRAGGSWTTYPLPGPAAAVATAGESLYAIAAGPGSAGTLWSVR